MEMKKWKNGNEEMEVWIRNEEIEVWKWAALLSHCTIVKGCQKPYRIFRMGVQNLLSSASAFWIPMLPSR